MRILLFLSRVTLLCNILFLLCVIIARTKDFIHNESINNYIIILGFSAPVLNFILTVLIIINMLRKKVNTIPAWLTITNFLFLIAQLMILFH